LMNRELLMLILEFVIRLFVVVAIPFGYKLVKKFSLEKAIKNAVWAAEQLLKKEDPDGEKRKAFVKEFILDKFKIDEKELEILIEAYVKQLNLIQNETSE